MFGVLELGLRLFQPVEGGWGRGIGGFVRVDEEGQFSVLDLYGGVGDPGLEVQDGVGVELEGFEDAVNFGVLAWEVRL